MEKQRNDISNIFTGEDMENINRIPDAVSYEIYERHNFYSKTLISM